VWSGERVIDAGGDAAAVDVNSDDAAAINDTYIDTLNLWVAQPLCILAIAAVGLKCT